MAKVVLYMSMSDDGFITGPDDGMDHGLGVNGERLHDWLRANPASRRPRLRPGGRDILLHGAALRRRAFVPACWMRCSCSGCRCCSGRAVGCLRPPDHIELELLRALDGPGVLHLRYRVRSSGVR
jgi:hypothetical protein